MCRERIVFRIAGILILLALGLGYYLSPGWYLLAAFVGVNLLQASFTGFCPLSRILAAMHISACDGSARIA